MGKSRFTSSVAVGEADTSGVNAQGYAEYRHDQTGIEFVRLPGGTFEMESPDTERWRRVDEGPVHTVTLDPFLIARTEVTQAQYNAVMSVNPDYENPSKFLGDDRRPVESMSRGNLYSPDGFLALTGLGLPSEAQWKYACRGGTTTAFSWGDEYNGFDEPCSPADDYMWWIGNTPDPPGNFPYPTSPVGQKLPNPLGLFDMHGNVSEWCEDAYDATFYSKPEALGPNPVATSSLRTGFVGSSADVPGPPSSPVVARRTAGRSRRRRNSSMPASILSRRRRRGVRHSRIHERTSTTS